MLGCLERFGVMRFCVLRAGVLRFGVLRAGVLRFGVLRFGAARLGVARVEVARFGVIPLDDEGDHAEASGENDAVAVGEFGGESLNSMVTGRDLFRFRDIGDE